MKRAQGTVGKRPGRPGLWLRWHEGGRRRIRRAASDVEAEARAELADLLVSNEAARIPGAPTFARFAADVYVPIHRAEVSEGTFARSARVIERFSEVHGGALVSAITVTDVRSYVASRAAAGIAPATLRRELSAIRPIFESAIDAGLMTANPCRVRIKGAQARRTRLLEPDQLAAVLRGASPMYRGILTLIVDAGLRRGTAVDLLWSDIAPDLSTLIRDDKANAKRKVPAVPLTRRCRAVLRAIRKAQPEGECRVFPHVSPNSLRLYWQRHREALGLPGWHLHDFRHQFASEALAHGAPHAVVADLLGHTSPALVVRTYGTSTAPDAARAAMRALERGRRP